MGHGAVVVIALFIHDPAAIPVDLDHTVSGDIKNIVHAVRIGQGFFNNDFGPEGADHVAQFGSYRTCHFDKISAVGRSGAPPKTWSRLEMQHQFRIMRIASAAENNRPVCPKFEVFLVRADHFQTDDLLHGISQDFAGAMIGQYLNPLFSGLGLQLPDQFSAKTLFAVGIAGIQHPSPHCFVFGEMIHIIHLRFTGPVDFLNALQRSTISQEIDCFCRPVIVSFDQSELVFRQSQPGIFRIVELGIGIARHIAQGVLFGVYDAQFFLKAVIGNPVSAAGAQGGSPDDRPFLQHEHFAPPYAGSERRRESGSPAANHQNIGNLIKLHVQPSFNRCPPHYRECNNTPWKIPFLHISGIPDRHTPTRR